MFAFAPARNIAEDQSFLVWVYQTGGATSVLFMLGLFGCMFWYMWWFSRWWRRLSAAAFSMTRNDLFRGVGVGFGLAAVWLLTETVIIWQRQAPFLTRQAWETRIVGTGMFLIVGATTATTVFQIRRFKRTFTKPGG
jgi:hypothetical protein